MKNFSNLIVTVTSAFLLLSGCATVPTVEKRYEGPDKSQSEIVILSVENIEYHYLPGIITSSIPYQGPVSGINVNLTFQGVAGHKYRMRFGYSVEHKGETFGGQVVCVAWIIDETTGIRVTESVKYANAD